jgi:hypothetical protein
MRPGTSKVLACFIVAAALPVAAQLPTPARSGELRGLVVDEAGKPLEGVVVVARWEWLQWIPPRLHGGGYYQNNGEAIHVGESVTNRAGEYRIEGWGPKVKTGGKLDDNQPQVLAFKSGYEPATGKRDETLRLKKWEGSNADYAQRILKFQRGADDYGGVRGGPTLAWRQTEDWRDMPRMIEALHRERLRLGEDGAKILGANVLKGRLGEGTVLDAATRKPVEFAILSITWTMRRSDGSPGEMRVVQAKSGLASGSKFWVSPWRVPGPQVEGWEIATGATPVVRVYAPGYRRSADIRWTEAGSTVLMEKLPDTRDAIVAELATWKRDIEAALALGDRQAMLALQRPLIASLAQQCNKLTPDSRGSACFSPGSDVSTFLTDARHGSVGYMAEDEENVRVVRVVAANAPASRIQAQAVAITPGAMAVSPGSAAIGGRPMERPRVGGFSIEPAR